MHCRGDGYLWDADEDGYDPEDFDRPCPQCNTQAYLERAREEAESVSCGCANGHRYTGESLWQSAVTVATAANPTGVTVVLKAIGPVRALRPRDRQGFECAEVLFQH